MSFFNKKEDVLEIELTQFGKKLLSEGNLEPYYYAFYDDDIIYDNQYAGLSNETGSRQSDAEVRIKDVPRTRTQHVYTGIETEIQRNNMLIRSGEVINEGKATFVGKKSANIKEFEVKNDRNFSSYNSIANSALSSKFIPAWNLMMYKGEISSSIPYLTSSTNAVPQRIPQIDMELEYIVSVQTVDETEAFKQTQTQKNKREAATRPERLKNIQNDYVIDILDFQDGTSIKVAQKQILIKLEELNVDFKNDNFEIEVFEMTSSLDIANRKKEVLTPVYFPKKISAKSLTGDQAFRMPNVTGDTSFIKYFFDLNVDFEIAEQDICPVIEDERKDGNIYDDMYECPDLEVIRRTVDSNLQDVYDSGIEERIERGETEIEEC
jgi:hypothetical protein